MLQQPVRGNLSAFIKDHAGCQFVIPVFQRNYTWNPEKETAKFISDLENVLNHPEVSHFLGILIYQKEYESTAFPQWKIIDGQQRLTTTFLYLLALRKACSEKGQKDCIAQLEEEYLYNKETTEDHKMRLKPSVSSDEVYAKIVYDHTFGLSQKEKESYVYRNYMYLLKWIRSQLNKHKGTELLEALQRMDILQFPLSSSDNAQQIFESINATGAPLTSADLIRNAILMNDPNDVQERLYAMYWKPLENIFTDSKKLEEFFRFYLACKTYNLYAKKDVYEGFRNYVSMKKMESEAVLRDCNRYAVYYQELYQGPCEAPKLEKALEDFRITSSSVPAPFLMELYGMYRNKEIGENSLIQIVRLLETYLVRRVLCGMDNSQLARYFPSLLRSVIRTFRVTHQDVYTIIQLNLVEYNKGKAYAMPTDEQVRTSLKESNAYALPMIRSLLERIEHDGASAKVDTSALNIEHIMPQHPNAYWKKNSGAQSDEEYAYLVNLLGNLTLCASRDNRQMGNEDFAYKKKILKQTEHIRLNTEILNLKQWNKKQIRKRGEDLTNRILKIYSYQNVQKEKIVASVDDVVTLVSPTANARAIYHNPKDVEILPGTTLKAYAQRDMQKMKGKYENLVARGIIQEDSNGQAHFENTEHFGSLNEAAQFLMHRGGENSQAWNFEDGRSVLKNTKEKPVEKVVKKKETKQPKKPDAQKEAKKESKPAETKKAAVKAKPEKKAEKKKAASNQKKATQPKKTQAKKSAASKPEKKKSVVKAKQEPKKTNASSMKKNGGNTQSKVKQSATKANGSSKKKRGGNTRGFVPQKNTSRSEQQPVPIVRFAGQGM